MIDLVILSSILGFVTLVLFRELGLAWCRLCFTFWCSLFLCWMFSGIENFAMVFLLSNTFYFVCEKVVPE
jgi:hypothetical protein